MCMYICTVGGVAIYRNFSDFAYSRHKGNGRPLYKAIHYII